MSKDQLEINKKAIDARVTAAQYSQLAPVTRNYYEHARRFVLSPVVRDQAKGAPSRSID